MAGNVVVTRHLFFGVSSVAGGLYFLVTVREVKKIGSRE